MRKILAFFTIMFICLLAVPAIIVGPLAKSTGAADVVSEPSDSSINPNATYNPNSDETDKVKPEDKFEHFNGQLPETIKVYFHKEEKVKEVKFEDYVKGAVLGEMPLTFSEEALKAQAVAARTFLYNKVYNNSSDEPLGAVICTDSNHCQAYRDPDDALAVFAQDVTEESKEKIRKLESAIEDTKGVIMTYEDKPISALYHSCSGGKTENDSDVWDGSGKPYLVSVESPGEESATSFKTVYEISKKDFINKIKENGVNGLDESNVFKSISDVVRTSSDRIKTLKIGDKVFKGTDMRKIFEFRSTNLWFEDKGDIIKVTSYGFGHGVGMSQWGANARAAEGNKFEDILKFYYKGVDVVYISP